MNKQKLLKVLKYANIVLITANICLGGYVITKIVNNKNWKPETTEVTVPYTNIGTVTAETKT